MTMQCRGVKKDGDDDGDLATVVINVSNFIYQVFIIARREEIPKK